MRTLLTALILFVALAAPAMAQDMTTLAREIKRLDDEIYRYDNVVKNNRFWLEEVNAFSASARQWFLREAQLKEAMREAQDGGDVYQYQAFEGQLNSLRSLDGQQVRAWDNTTVTSLEALREKFTEAGNALPGVHEETNRALAELETLRPKRKKLAAIYSDRTEDHSLRVKGLQEEYNALQADRDYLESIAQNPEYWCLSGQESLHGTFPIYMHRGVVIELLTQAAMKQSLVNKTPFDSEWLSESIRQVQAESNAAKDVLNRERIPEILDRMRQIEQELASLGTDSSITGCWVVNTANGPVRILIRKQGHYTYLGELESGTWMYRVAGETVFGVEERDDKPAGTFVGTQYGHDPYGNTIKAPLVITVHDGSLSYQTYANYNFDEPTAVFSMTPCE